MAILGGFWCGTAKTQVFSQPISLPKKDQNILVRVLWCGPAQTRRGNRLKCFYDHLLFENQNPRHRCWGFCGVGRPPITFS